MKHPVDIQLAIAQADYLLEKHLELPQNNIFRRELKAAGIAVKKLQSRLRKAEKTLSAIDQARAQVKP